jgi:pimeloyl-ACP methyl ester carboxylesterase
MFDLQGTGQSQVGVALPGPGQVGDVLGAVRYARYHIAQAAPIVLVGDGWGGTVALLAAEQSPDISGVLADTPFSSLATELRQNLAAWTHLPAGPFRGLLLRAWPLVTGIHPSAVDPLAGLAQLGKRPVLFVVGAKDAPAVLRQDRTLAAADAASQLWVAPVAGPLQAWRQDHAAYLQHLGNWLTLAASPSA